MSFHAPTPILRIFDEAKAQEFYVTFLGFTVDWQHRFEPDAPLYMQVSRGACTLHLSEHHGDASPGSTVRVLVDELEEYHRELSEKKYKYYRPGLQDQEWGAREMAVEDGFGNKLIFFRQLSPTRELATKVVDHLRVNSRVDSLRFSAPSLAACYGGPGRGTMRGPHAD